MSFIHDTILKGLARFVKNNTGGAMDYTNSENPYVATDTSGSSNGFDTFWKGINNLWKGITGSGVTQRDVELNQMNMQNVEDTAARQVAGYDKAGVNPALMYSGGASNSAPQASAAQTTGSMSELMQAIMMPLQMRMMQAQIGNVKAQTGKTLTETGQIKQLMEWYPKVTQEQLKEIASRYNLNYENMELAKINQEIAEADKVIKQAEADNASAFYKARADYEAAKTPQAKAAAAADMARAAWDTYQKNYTESHDGAMPSSSSILALVNALSSWLHVEPGAVGKEVNQAVTSALSDVKGIADEAATFVGNKTKVGRAAKKVAKKYLPRTFEFFKRQLRQ